MNEDIYVALREAVFAAGYRHEYDWAQNVKPPSSPEALFMEYAWVVVNSGMKNQIAHIIMDRITNAILQGKKVREVFGNRLKAEAIQQAYDLRAERFDAFNRLSRDDFRFAWFTSLPFIGPVTKYHLAKNCGIDVAKPDRWLERVAAESGEEVQELCERLARESGDRVATVDLIIWRACNLHIYEPEVAA